MSKMIYSQNIVSKRSLPHEPLCVNYEFKWYFIVLSCIDTGGGETDMSMSNVNSQMKVSISHSNLFKSVQAYRVLLHIKWEKDKFELDQVNYTKKKIFTHFLFIFVCVCVSLSLYLSFCKSSSQSMSSPDDKLSENIWFAWSRTSYGGDKWRCHHRDELHQTTNNKGL